MNFFYASGGALVCDEPIKGITSDTSTSEYWDSSWYEGHRYFVAESMNKETARRLAHALGGVLIDGYPVSRQLVGATVNIERELTRHAMYGEHPRRAAS